MEKFVIITQARTGSTRFPNKVIKKISDKTLLDIHLERLKMTKEIHKIIVATTNDINDNIIVDIAKKNNVHYFRGSESNVLSRYWNSIKDDNIDYIIRVTSDCPLIDSNLINLLINEIKHTEFDYISNTLTETYPDGQDIEIFKKSALEKAYLESTLDSHKEHVTLYIKENSNNNGLKLFNAKSIEHNPSLSDVRLTVDQEEDFTVIKQLIREIGITASWEEYTKLYQSLDLKEINGEIIRNEGLLKSLKNENRTRII